ncbi:unnamed protein product [Lymnaea stagnalis]|uniref:HAUS augmin-like complex subunit 6 N-terminal domain-containing protein n=1 Tax=Lymnaea stagnalis TaxID=6523 RepID=A0AAV2GXV6_LYMST
MEVDEISTILFTNLQLLGMDVVDMEGRYKIPFNKSMFNLPNKAGSEAVLHFLFNRLNPTLCKEQFRDCWPVSDKKTELQFRKVCNNWLTQIQKDEVDARLPRMNASLLLSPGGRKFVYLIYKFSTFVLVQVMKTESGFSTESTLVYPNLTPNISFLADVTLSAIQDNCTREGEQFFERLHLITAACKNWKEYIGEMIKDYRRIVKRLRDSEHEKRLEVNVTADSALQYGCSLPAKRAITMFDSGTDSYSALRCQRVAKAGTQWSSLSNFHERMDENRNIIQSILDRSTLKHSINGTEMGIRVPGLLLREFDKEIHKKIDNVYTGGVLNLVSVISLWNVCLKLYLEQLKTETLPDVASELPHLGTQAHTLHCHLKSTQELKDEMRTKTFLELQRCIKSVQKRLKDVKLIPKSGKHNDIGLGLTDPSPLAAPVTKKPTQGQTPTGPMAAPSSNKNTPDTVLQTSNDIESTVLKTTLAPQPQFSLGSLSSLGSILESSGSERRNKGGPKPAIQTAVKPTKMKAPVKALNHTNPKTQQRNKPLTRQPLASASAVHQVQTTSSIASSMSSTPRTSKQKAVDLLVDEVVGAVLNFQPQQEDSSDSSSPMKFGILDESVFASKNRIERSPVQKKSIVSKANLSQHLTRESGTLENSTSHLDTLNTSSSSVLNHSSNISSRILNVGPPISPHSAEMESSQNYMSLIDSDNVNIHQKKMIDRPPGDGQASPDSKMLANKTVLASGKPSRNLHRSSEENRSPRWDHPASPLSTVANNTPWKLSADQIKTPSMLSLSQPVDHKETTPATKKSVDMFSPVTTPRHENSSQKLFSDLESSPVDMLEDFSDSSLNQILLNHSDLLLSPPDLLGGKHVPDLFDFSVKPTGSPGHNTLSHRGHFNFMDPPARDSPERKVLVLSDLQGDGDSDSEPDLDSSYAPVKEGILLSSGKPKKKKSSLEHSENIQAKLEMLKQKWANIYDGTLEDPEEPSPRKLDSYERETSNHDLLKVPDDDDDDLLSTELMHTNLLDESDEQL